MEIVTVGTFGNSSYSLQLCDSVLVNRTSITGEKKSNIKCASVKSIHLPFALKTVDSEGNPFDCI